MGTQIPGNLRIPKWMIWGYFRFSSWRCWRPHTVGKRRFLVSGGFWWGGLQERSIALAHIESAMLRADDAMPLAVHFHLIK